MYSVKVAGLDEFRDGREAWNALVSGMAFPSIFCTWEWIYTWWEHFGEEYQLLILFIYDGSELKGILPLTSRKVVLKNDWLIGRILSYCGSGEVYPDHLDVISSKEEAASCLTAISHYLFSEYKEWDVLQLLSLSEGNNFTKWFADNDHQFSSDIKRSSSAPFMSLPGSSDEYLCQLHSKKKYNLRKMERLLDEKHGMKYVSCDGNDLENQQTLKTLFELHEKRAKQKKITSTFQGASIVNFHENVIKRMQHNNWLWLKTLRSDDTVIAVWYGFAFKGRIFYYQIGHDPGWEQYGPGKILMYNAIKEACDGNYGEFDFLRGNEDYKSFWTTKRRLLLTANIYNSNFKGRLSRSLYRTKLALKSLTNRNGH